MLSRCVVYSKPSHLPGHTTISLSLELENESCQLTPCIDIVLNRTWNWTFKSFTTFNWVIALLIVARYEKYFWTAKIFSAKKYLSESCQEIHFWSMR